MELQIYCYKPDLGWDRTPDASLDSDQTLLILFAASRLSGIEHPLEELRNRFPNSISVGCSTAGEIYGDELSEDSLVLAVARFQHTRLRVVCTSLTDVGESSQAGKELADSLLEDDLRGLFVLSEGLQVNGTRLIEGLNQVLPRSVVVTGGLAGDDDRFEQTWVLEDGIPRPGTICGVGFYGDAVGIGYGSKGGWDMLGHEREVTSSEENVLYELDGQPALDIYKRYLGERAAGLPATGLLFPLSMRDETAPDELKVRTILSVDDKAKSITFAGNIPEGSFVRLMHANFDRLIDGAAGAAEDINTEGYTGGPLLCLAISCVGRKLVLGQRTEEEIEAALEVLPEGSRQIGYYSYGELSPLNNGRCDLHNQTMTLTLIWERME